VYCVYCVRRASDELGRGVPLRQQLFLCREMSARINCLDAKYN